MEWGSGTDCPAARAPSVVARGGVTIQRAWRQDPKLQKCHAGYHRKVTRGGCNPQPISA